MTDADPTVPELAQRLRETYTGLRAALDQTPPAAADAGGWSARQVLAHVAFWDRYQTDRLQRALAGESAPTELDEQANAALENDDRAATERRSCETTRRPTSQGPNGGRSARGSTPGRLAPFSGCR